MNRQCGVCTLCCKLLPVRELNKPSNTRCIHQRALKGCSVYERRQMPTACKLWNCRWLVNDDTADMPRPDHCGYVIDIMPDYITASEDGRDVQIPVVQIWIDRPLEVLRRDKALIAYMLRRGAEGYGTLLRDGSSAGFAVLPPTLLGRDEWIVKAGCNSSEHSFEQIAAAIAGISNQGG